MDESTKLTLIRHADVDTGPPPGRLCGWLDLPLSERGRARLARLLQTKAGDHALDALYTSPLSRAREVAEALSRVWGLPPLKDDGLREIGCGQFEGMPIEKIQREYPELWARNESQEEDDFAWPGGESYRDFRARVMDALRRVAEQHRGRRVAVVTHAGVIAQVIGVVRRRPAAEWKPDRPGPLTMTDVSWSNGTPGAVCVFDEPDWL